MFSVQLLGYIDNIDDIDVRMRQLCNDNVNSDPRQIEPVQADGLQSGEAEMRWLSERPIV